MLEYHLGYFDRQLAYIGEKPPVILDVVLDLLPLDGQAYNFFIEARLFIEGRRYDLVYLLAFRVGGRERCMESAFKRRSRHHRRIGKLRRRGVNL